MSEPSRLGREQAETAYVLKRIADGGARVFYYLEDREAKLDDTTGKFIEAVHAFGSELERERTRQRTIDGMLKRAQAGYSTGGVVFGYRSVPVYTSGRQDAYGRPIPDHVDRKIEPAEAKVVLGMYQMCLAGYGLTAIAKTLNGDPRRVKESAEFFSGARPPAPRKGSGSWAGSAVREILRRPLYAGKVVRGGHAAERPAAWKAQAGDPTGRQGPGGSPHRGARHVGRGGGPTEGPGRGLPPVDWGQALRPAGVVS
jgi:Recombinase/Resolvase, N terminal domain